VRAKSVGVAPVARTWYEALGDVLVHQDRFYILATSSLAEGRRHVLKHGDAFAVFDRNGDIKPMGHGEEGLFFEGTRYLSSFLLRLGNERPLFLSSAIDENNALAVDLTNPDIRLEGDLLIPRGSVHLLRSRLLVDGCCYEQWTLRNFGAATIRVALSLHFDADYTDIFEVRGARRARRGERLPTELTLDEALLAYEGLDGEVRRTALTFDPPPAELGDSHADFELALPAGAEAALTTTVECLPGGRRAPRREPRHLALERAAAELAVARAETGSIESSNEQFNDWLGRSLSDLHMMETRSAQGSYPYAGVPWFSTPFGRDGILTALECLWIWPDLARGVLAYLAAHQATEVNLEQDAEPGKILHETRKGEMAALGEIPFGCYYGSVDATPLFVVLAGEYYLRSGDLEFARLLWPAVSRALDWIDRWGDADGDGFVEYRRHNPEGLVHQGWKDSNDAVFHADGSPAEGSIALCEVQGYVYSARRHAANLARALGHESEAAHQLRLAEELRRKFEAAFWSEVLGTYVLALDGAARPCAVRTSNAGHCLFSGIVARERAARTVATLTSAESFSGWGIRTVAAGQARFNPMSYHNGSIWPHDNALVAAGCARYGKTAESALIFGAIFDISLFVDLHRLPELICGFDRRPGSGPTLYPVACAPQAWAAGAVFLFLQSALGLAIDAPRREVRFRHPTLPGFLQQLRIRDLRVGDASVDLELTRHPSAVGINVLRKQGQLDVVTVK
jgi:glycogen debranching enzyme